MTSRENDLLNNGYCCIHVIPGTDLLLWRNPNPKDYSGESILVPIALFSSLSRRGLGTRIEGLWGHRIFELIHIFLIGCLKTKKSWTEVRMFARIAGAKVGNSCDQRCWAVFKREDEKENLSLLQQNGFFRNARWYFRLRKQQRAGNFKSAWALNGVRNYVWRWFTSETVRTTYRKVKNIKKFRSLLLASLSSQELSIEGPWV